MKEDLEKVVNYLLSEIVKLNAECESLKLAVSDLADDKKQAFLQIQKNSRFFLQKILEGIENDDPHIAALLDRRKLEDFLREEESS